MWKWPSWQGLRSPRAFLVGDDLHWKVFPECGILHNLGTCSALSFNCRVHSRNGMFYLYTTGKCVQWTRRAHLKREIKANILIRKQNGGKVSSWIQCSVVLIVKHCVRCFCWICACASSLCQDGSRVEAVQRSGGADASVLWRLQWSPPSAVPAVLWC